MIIDQNLQQAIDQLYQVFAHYPLTKVVFACPCCHTKADQTPIHSKPLHELTENDLSKYTFDALLTWGDENDFRHFLPRIFELVTTAESIVYTDGEIVIKKLLYGNWRTWPENEQTAIKNYLAALWQSVLNIPITEHDQQRGFSEVNTTICAIAQAEDDLTPYLQTWLHIYTQSALAQLSQFVTINGHSIVHYNTLQNDFWTDRKQQMTQVIDWLKNPETAHDLENVFFENPDALYADILASAIDNLNWLVTATTFNYV